MIAPLVVLILSSQVPGQSELRPLTLADVRMGDFVRYDLGNGTLELRACARRDDTLIVAVSVKPRDTQPRAESLLQGALLELSQRPLQPLVELEGGAPSASRKGPGFELHDCEVWHGPNVTDATSSKVRCTGPEVILGGGFVFEEHTYLLNGASHWSRGLSAAGNDPRPCPNWPRAHVDGWTRTLDIEDGKRELTESHFTAGSVWVRTTTRQYAPAANGSLHIGSKAYSPKGKPETEDQTLAELLLDAATGYLGTTGEAKAGQRAIGKHQLPVSTVSWKGGSASWPAPPALSDAPLAARISPVAFRGNDSAGALLGWGSGDAR